MIFSGFMLIFLCMSESERINLVQAAEGATLSRPIIRARVLRSIFDAVPTDAMRRAHLLDREGLVASDLLGADASVPLASYLRLFDRLSQELGRPTLGLDLSVRLGPELVGAVGYVFLHSPTLDSAIAAFAEAVSSIQGVTSLQYERGTRPVVRYVIGDDRLHPRRHDVEFSLGYVHGLIKCFLGDDYAPHEVHFEHHREAPLGRYEEMFGCPVYFEQSGNALILRRQDLQRSGRMHDPHLVSILQHYMKLARPDGLSPQTVAQEVDELLAGMIESGNASCRLVAARLGISEETLRRRLAREGTSFRQLLRRRRCAIASRCLVETGRSILQVSQLVGYAETACFTRAFMAETGFAPTEFRRRHRP